MKPAPFAYHRAHDIDDAVDVLARFADEAKVLAGGQSLVPLMNLRLARPARLLDINAVPGLTGIATGDGDVSIGALTRHAMLERTDLPGPLGRLLRTAARHIGHLPIRTRGTIGGSIAHCDPVAEWCLVARLLDAQLVVRSARGTRRIPAGRFFSTIFTSTLAADELLCEVRLPLLDRGHAVGLAEFARRPGDFAVVAALADLAISDGRIIQARICLGGVSDVPLRPADVERALVGQPPAPDVFVAAAQAAATASEPTGDAQASVELRRDLVRALVERALREAAVMHEGEEAA